jgi:prepilin-type N-terminal cleavage/methylation domain-containing protein
MIKQPSLRPAKRLPGFTIVELMIATMVFSVVLLVVASGILQISRVYYKGVTETNTQNTARNIMDTISQAIQFSGGDITPSTSPSTPSTSYAFCAGGQQFSYTIGYQVDDTPIVAKHQSYHALVVNPTPGCTTAAPQTVTNPAVSGRELLGAHMRLTNIIVQPVSGAVNAWKVQVRVVYGDDDLLTTPVTSTTASCKGQHAGSQFCSVAELSTVVVKRVQ